jgi:hypothetical protein
VTKQRKEEGNENEKEKTIEERERGKVKKET